MFVVKALITFFILLFASMEDVRYREVNNSHWIALLLLTPLYLIEGLQFYQLFLIALCKYPTYKAVLGLLSRRVWWIIGL